MSIKYKTKPLTLPDSVQEIWEVLAQVEELFQIQQKEIYNLRARVKRIERTTTSEDADTLRFDEC